jgi:pimeloyl-ACP methyl ester carboxylesterase
VTGPFHYHRSESWSEHLKRSVSYGVLSLSENHYQESLYLFHGGNGDDQQFVQAQLTEVISPENLELLRSRGVRIFLPFIGVSLLQGSYSDYFFSELLPRLEDDLSRPRHIGGWSMGGFAALSAFFRRPEMFNSVGAHFPSLIDFDFKDQKEIEKFSKRVGIDTQHLEILLGEYKRVFPSFIDFKKSDPISIVSSIDPELLKSKKIFFDVGSKDDFGLFEGAAALAKVLSEKKIAHSYACIEGGRHDGAFLHARINSLIHSALFMS